jgi:hypothetical protein
MDHASKTKILNQLTRTGGEIAEKALEKEAARIATALENETDYDLLEQQIELLDIFAFRVPQTAVGLVWKFIARLSALELTHDDQIALSKVDLTKYRNKNILIIGVLKLLDRIRYHRLEDILEIFLSHSRNENEGVRIQANQGLEHVAEYNIDIYYSGDNQAGFGPAPQLKILERLEALDKAAQKQNFPAITQLCKLMLSPSMSRTTWDYKTVTWSTTSIPATDEIKGIRLRSINLLKRLYGIATTAAEKMAILNALLESTRTAHQNNYGDDVLEMVSGNTLEILAFFKQLLPGEDLPVIQKIEHDAFWRFRHAPSNEVKAAALEVRDILAKHDEYSIYKTLIGFEGVFEDWEESLTKEPNFVGIDEYRSAKATEYASCINEGNWPEWRNRILRYAKTESNDLATFPNFFEFLRQFAEKSPDLAFGLLTENLDDIRPFTIPLLRGLWKGPRKADLRALMVAWIAADLQLVAITKLFISNENIDDDLLQVLLDKSEKDVNRDILVLIATVAVSNYADGRKDLIPKFFLPAVDSLTKIADAGWINELWFRKELRSILESLNEEGREIILGSLLVAKEIDYHAEEILIPLAKDNPQRIITFFGERERRGEQIELQGRYDAIPYAFHELHKTLAGFPELAVDTVRLWFDEDEALFQYRGANLLKIIFPDFPEPFEVKLLKLVRSGERQDVEFVLTVLRNYEGKPFLLRICREIVATLPENDKRLKTVEIVLISTGVLMGEFGFAEAYERKIEEIKPWLTDDNERVRKFSAGYVSSLKKQAKSERLRAEEGIELRKHAYGVREEKAGQEDGANEQQKTANKGGDKDE